MTIATNMAGRGTDIQLGGNLEFLVNDELSEMPEGPERDAAIAKIKEQIAAEKAAVLAAGGLHVIGTERHESAPHRQSAAWPFGPPGRSRPKSLLSQPR